MKQRTVMTLLAVAILVSGFAAWNWAGWRSQAVIGAGFAARVACGCRYVEGRPFESCRSDLRGLGDLRLVGISDLPDRRAVEASVPLMARREARFTPGFGCLLDPA